MDSNYDIPKLSNFIECFCQLHEPRVSFSAHRALARRRARRRPPNEEEGVTMRERERGGRSVGQRKRSDFFYFYDSHNPT